MSLADSGDELKEYCGVFAAYAPGEEVARIAFFALYALQHRGQESAGIATGDGTRLHVHAQMGLVNQVFDEGSLSKLIGPAAIGHTRYSTTGSSRVDNAQPFIVKSDLGPIALGHNGNLTNANYLREELNAQGIYPVSSTDSELIGHICAQTPGATWIERIRRGLQRLEGAFCLVMATPTQVFAVRDPFGIRPLCLGRLATGAWVAASESCALDTVGAQFIRELEPGEIVTIDAMGLHTEKLPPKRRAACSFEHIYFARPDSIIDGCLVYSVRERMGQTLAEEHPVDADLVMPVPDAATPAAIGYARASGIPFSEGLVKNRYIGRTFIQPDQSMRDSGVALKLNPLPEVLNGKRIVVVDDSIVRGTTTPRVVEILRRAGAREVHMRISSPPMRYPCYLGVDTAPIEQLIAATRTVDEIRQHIGADSLGYLSIGGLIRAIGLPEDTFCNACFHGDYPIPVQLGLDKLVLERP
ncbi:MAG: amidophosphoribosyltransferase [Chloroflexota bacterium]